MMQSSFYHKIVLLMMVSCIFLTACQSTKTETQPLTKQQYDAAKARADALAARGFYETSLGNINYLQGRQCNSFQLQSHRGSIRYAENSLNAVIDSLDNNFDVIEIDVRITRDDVWVVHHDAKTGRATGTIDNKRRKVESIRYEKEWGYLRHRDQNTGLLTDVVPPSFTDLATLFSRHRKTGQTLNIEIKSKASVDDLKLLDYLAFRYLGTGNYYYSSLEMRNLTRMREINPTIYLAYIQTPAKQSMNQLAKSLKRAAGSDPIYERNKEQLESLQALGNRYARVKRYDNPIRLDQLTKQLKANFGYVLDIRHYLQSAGRLKTAAAARGIKIATYSINGHAYHERSLLKQAPRLHPNSVIIDDSVYGFCSVFSLPKVASFYSDDPVAKQIASLPDDLDLERLDELQAYLENQLYPAVGGRLQSTIAPKTQSAPSTSQFNQPLSQPNLEVGTRQEDEDFNLETNPVVEIELRKK